MIKLSDFIKNNRLDYILERKNFVKDEELKKRYNGEDILYLKRINETHIKSLDEDERCLGFYEYLEKRKKK